MNAKQMYQCSICDSTWETQYEAEECCQPEVFTVWMCGECDTEYDDKDHAEDCCPEVEPLGTPHGWQSHIDELERAGQTRLSFGDQL